MHGPGVVIVVGEQLLAVPYYGSPRPLHCPYGGQAQNGEAGGVSGEDRVMHSVGARLGHMAGTGTCCAHSHTWLHTPGCTHTAHTFMDTRLVHCNRQLMPMGPV